MAAGAWRGLALDVRQGLGVVMARLDAVHPLMLAPVIGLLVMILALAAIVAVVLLAGSVLIAATAGLGVCLRRVLVAAVAFEGGRRPAMEAGR